MIFYHVSRSGREEAILKEGLRPDLMDDRWERPQGRRAVFLWGSLRSAFWAREACDSFGGTLDGEVFRVRIPKNWVRPDTTDRYEDEPEDRYACFRRIPPERLEIVRERSVHFRP